METFLFECVFYIALLCLFEQSFAMVYFTKSADFTGKTCGGNKALVSTNIRSTMGCLMLCAARSSCVAAFYKAGGSCVTCSLYALQLGTNLIDDAGTTYFYIPITCQSGWVKYEDSCYFLEHNRKAYGDARTYCNGKGGGSKLVEIQSTKENTFLTNYLTSLKIVGHEVAVWTGGVYRNGDWKWDSNSESIGDRFWAPHEPNSNTENCINMYRDLQYGWNDGRCSSAERPLCEIEYT